MRTENRTRLVRKLRWHLEKPLLVLSFVWIGLVAVQMINPELPYVVPLSNAIWAIFVVDFISRLIIAPHKLAFLKCNWLTAVALLLPALRVFRVFWVFRFARYGRLARLAGGSRMIRLISAANRGMRALITSLGKRGFGYVVLLIIMITFLGAAGMYAFERNPAGRPYFNGYLDALWWTAMIMTTMGSQYWPQTVEGRILCLSLAVFAFAIFGYVTANIAIFFIGGKEPASANQLPDGEIKALREEIRQLRLALECQAPLAGTAPKGQAEHSSEDADF